MNLNWKNQTKKKAQRTEDGDEELMSVGMNGL
jgi:hypothetical protein